jgi:hypothetical protein
MMAIESMMRCDADIIGLKRSDCHHEATRSKLLCMGSELAPWIHLVSSLLQALAALDMKLKAPSG